MRGVLLVPIQLKEFANKVREKEIPISEADRVAKELHLDLIIIKNRKKEKFLLNFFRQPKDRFIFRNN